MPETALSPRFTVSIDGIALGTWTKCEGLAVEYEVFEYQEGGFNDYVHRLPGHVLERGFQVLGPIADDFDHRGIDPHFTKPLGQPRPVAVGNDACQDLGSRDQDAGARSHAQRGIFDAGSGEFPSGANRKPIAVDDGLTFTSAPLTFIWTELLPSVSSIFGAVFVGIVWPLL